MLRVSRDEIGFLRTILQNHIWGTSSNKQAIMAQDLLDRLKALTEPVVITSTAHLDMMDHLRAR